MVEGLAYGFLLHLPFLDLSSSFGAVDSIASFRACFFPIDVFAVEQSERFSEEIARETRQSKHPSRLSDAPRRAGRKTKEERREIKRRERERERKREEGHGRGG